MDANFLVFNVIGFAVFLLTMEARGRYLIYTEYILHHFQAQIKVID